MHIFQLCGGVFSAFDSRMRMRARMDFAKLHDGYIGVDLRGVEPGVSEQLLDEADVGPVFEHVGGAGVAQQMAGTGAADAGRLDDAATQLPR
jgi:hypothetical protein